MALVLYFTQSSSARKLIVPAAVTVMAVAAVILGANGAFRLEIDTILGLSADSVFSVLDLLLLVYILGIGWKLGSRLIMGMTLLQLIGLLYLKFVLPGHEVPITAFVADGLSLIMVIIISVVASQSGSRPRMANKGVACISGFSRGGRGRPRL